MVEDDRIVFYSSPTPSPLSSELNQRGYQEKGGIIDSNFTTTPQQEEINPFDKKKKPHSNSPLFVRSPSPKQENIDNVLERLLDTVNDLETEISSTELDNDPENNLTLLTEIETLKANQAQLEKAYKILFDEKVEQERSLQNFNEKELA